MAFNGSSGGSHSGSAAASLGAGNGFPEPSHVDEWRRAHAALLAEEHIFAELVTRHAAGSVSLEQLEEGRRKLHALRALEDVVAHKAFGLPHG